MLQQFITKLSSAEKKLFYGASLFFLLAILDRVFLGPVSLQLKGLDEEIKKEQGNIKKDLRFLAYKNRILEEQDVFAPYFITKSETEEEIIADFLKRIEILATEADINLIRVTPLEGKQKKGSKEYQANLDCMGELSNIVKFMHLVDSSKELLKIVKMSLSAKKSETSEVNAALTVAKIMVDAAAASSSSEGKKMKTLHLKELGLGEEMNVNLDEGPKAGNPPPPPPPGNNLDQVQFSVTP